MRMRRADWHRPGSAGRGRAFSLPALALVLCLVLAACVLLQQLLFRTPALADSSLGTEPCRGSGLHCNSPARQQRIPKILHMVYFPSKEQYLADAQKPNPQFRAEWMETCLRYHPGWRLMFWDEESTQKLVQEHYPWLQEAYSSLGDSFTMKSDVLRFMAMHHLGGVYLDTDVECYRNMEDSLLGFDIVLQATVFDWEGVASGVMAAVPGHPMFHRMLCRVENNTRNELKEAWAPFRTGPMVIMHELRRYVPRQRYEGWHQGGDYAGEWATEGGTRIKVYPRGHWFTPCLWDDGSCKGHIMLQRAMGTLNLTSLVGFHRYTSSWISEKTADLPDQMIVNVTLNLAKQRSKAAGEELRVPAVASDLFGAKVAVHGPDARLIMYPKNHYPRYEADDPANVRMLRFNSLWTKRERSIRGSKIVEVGAGVGTDVAFLSGEVGAAGVIWAFEPQRILHQLACANMVLNNISNVLLEAVALGPTNGEASIGPAVGQGWGRKGVSLDSYTFQKRGQAVPMRTLDSYRLTDVSVIAVDAGAAGPLILYGARETIRRERPAVGFLNPSTVPKEAGKQVHEALNLQDQQKITGFNVVTFTNSFNYTLLEEEDMVWLLP